MRVCGSHAFIYSYGCQAMGTATDWWRTDCRGGQVYEQRCIWILRACLCHPPHIVNYLTMHYVQNMSHKNISRSSLVCKNYDMKNALIDLHTLFYFFWPLHAYKSHSNTNKVLVKHILKLYYTVIKYYTYNIWELLICCLKKKSILHFSVTF